MNQLINFAIKNRAGTRIGRATWIYLGLWALLLIATDVLDHKMHVIVFSETFFIVFALLSPFILLLNRLDLSGPTKEETERVAKELAAKKEAEYFAKEKSKLSWRLGKWVGRHKRLVKIVDVLSIRHGRFSIAGWIGIMIVIAALGTIYYQRTHYTNRAYLEELIESHTIERVASEFVISLRKTERENGNDSDWKVIEQSLTACMVNEANQYLESGDPYLLERANKNTPKILAARFLKKCGAID